MDRSGSAGCGHDRYGPANSDGHDDLLLALSLALWLADPVSNYRSSKASSVSVKVARWLDAPRVA